MPLPCAQRLDLVASCHPVPKAGFGVCAVCHGPRRTGFARCSSCAVVLGRVERPCLLVVPVTLYAIPSPLHAALRGYKERRSPRARRRLAGALAALLGRFVVEHGACLERAGGGPFDLVTSVPTSVGRPGPHPLAEVVRAAEGLAARYRSVLGQGSASLGHRQADDDGFVLRAPVAGRRVLLVDDTWTTGARAESAASALSREGATVVAVVVLGRVVDPRRGGPDAALWRWARSEPFRPERCCLCAGSPVRPLYPELHRM